MILDENLFVESGVARSILRKLSDCEMTAYRAPFLQRGIPSADAGLAASNPH